MSNTSSSKTATYKMEASLFARNKITKYLAENFLKLLKRAIAILQNTRRKPFVVKPAFNKIAEIDSRLVLLLIKNFDQEIFHTKLLL